MTLNRPLELQKTPLSEKILPRHLQRLAVVYVRQSTVQQVTVHQKSTHLQYALANRAVALGWPKQCVLVIDEDLGKSASSDEGREGVSVTVPTRVDARRNGRRVIHGLLTPSGTQCSATQGKPQKRQALRYAECTRTC
jgi:hypothetical protein